MSDTATIERPPAPLTTEEGLRRYQEYLEQTRQPLRDAGLEPTGDPLVDANLADQLDTPDPYNKFSTRIRLLANARLEMGDERAYWAVLGCHRTGRLFYHSPAQKAKEHLDCDHTHFETRSCNDPLCPECQGRRIDRYANTMASFIKEAGTAYLTTTHFSLGETLTRAAMTHAFNMVRDYVELMGIPATHLCSVLPSADGWKMVVLTLTAEEVELGSLEEVEMCSQVEVSATTPLRSIIKEFTLTIYAFEGKSLLIEYLTNSKHFHFASSRGWKKKVVATEGSGSVNPPKWAEDDEGNRYHICEHCRHIHDGTACVTTGENKAVEEKKVAPDTFKGSTELDAMARLGLRGVKELPLRAPRMGLVRRNLSLAA